MPRAAVAVGKALGGATVAVVQSAVLLAMAPLVGIHLSFGMYAGMVGVLAVLALSLNALGILVSTRVGSMQGFQVVMNFLVMPLFFLSGALYPLRGMPDWLGLLMRADPLTYGVDALRHLIFGAAGATLGIVQFSLATDLAVTGGVAVLLLALATWLFETALA